MQKATYAITVPHLFSPISALSKESNLHITTLRLNVQETLQINQSISLLSRAWKLLQGAPWAA